SQKVRYIRFQLPHLDSDAQEISATTREVLVRTRRHAFRLTLGEDEAGQIELTLVGAVELDEASVLIRGSLQDKDLALSIASGVLSKIGVDGKEICKVDLGTPWSAWSLLSACSCSIGILVLFDDGAAGQLGLLERDSLAVIRHYTDSRMKG